ncbi:MAG: PEP-CTERM sorting domain-containing protein [Acidobacteria bacterium]|nr:PEP-CTERM sorting domain-containing protein [Acidobacteriota bacterium]
MTPLIFKRLLPVLVLVQLWMVTAAAGPVLVPLFPGSVAVVETSNDPNFDIPNISLLVTNNNIPVPGDIYGPNYITHFAYTSSFVTSNSQAVDAFSRNDAAVCQWDQNGCAALGFNNTDYPYAILFPGETGGWVALWSARPEQGIAAGDTYNGFAVTHVPRDSAWVAFNGSGGIVDWSSRAPSEVPEPATGLLLAGGILTLALRRRRN